MDTHCFPPDDYCSNDVLDTHCFFPDDYCSNDVYTVVGWTVAAPSTGCTSVSQVLKTNWFVSATPPTSWHSTPDTSLTVPSSALTSSCLPPVQTPPALCGTWRWPKPYRPSEDTKRRSLGTFSEFFLCFCHMISLISFSSFQSSIASKRSLHHLRILCK